VSQSSSRTARRSARSYWAELQDSVGPTGLRPVLVLLLAAGVERFLISAVSVLAPNIRDSFHLSNQTFITAQTLAVILPAAASPWMGYWSDRTNRVRMSQLGAVAVGAVAIGMGVSPAFWVLALFLFAAGLGQLVNTPAHGSLIGDYYPPEAMGITWTFYLLASGAIALVAGPFAGQIGAAAGWRTVFVVLSIPVAAIVFALGRLKDPGRGASLGIAEQLAQAEERSSFWEGFRRVKAIRSLRRTWWSATFFGGGIAAFISLYSVFFKDVYHFGTAARGYIAAFFGLGGLLGTLLGGYLVQRRMQMHKPHLLPVINGLMVAEFGVGAILMAVIHNRWAGIAALGLVSIGLAGNAPAYQTMIGLVTPPRLRGQAYSYSLIWVTLGAIIVAPTIGGIANHHERAAAATLGALMLVSGGIEISARKFVGRDIEQAARVQKAADVDALLTVRGLSVAYPGNIQILFGVDLEVKRGEIVALLGTNGAGKSTLLRGVAGLVDPIGGSVFFAGRDVTHADPVTKALLGMALVPGDRGVFPGLTVADNLRIATWTFRKDEATVAEATDRVLAYFPVLHDRRNVVAGNLSGGEQQMLVLAQALMSKPKILMIDELSLGLSPVVVEQLLGIVRQLAEDGLTVLLVEQSVNVALTLAKRAVFMEKGEIRFSGATEELFNRPDVLRSVFLEGVAGTMEEAKPRRRVPTGDPRRNGSAHSGPAVLELAGLTKRFGGVVAVDQLDLKLYEGQILGLMGHNGAGKTTVFDLVSGYLSPDSGFIFLHGEDITRLSPDTRARMGLGRSFQDSRLFPAMTVQETIKVALERQVEVRDPLAAALRLPAVADSEAVIGRRASELIDLLGLSAYRNKFVSEISTGTRRMVDLACILAHEPTVILFDEPSSGIAQRETEQLGPVLRRVREATGSSLLVIEHDMPLLTSLADEVVALELGHPVARGLPQEVLHDPRVIASYLGTTPEAVSRSGARPTPVVGRRGRRATTSANGAGQGSNGRSAGGSPAGRGGARVGAAKVPKAAAGADVATAKKPQKRNGVGKPTRTRARQADPPDSEVK
jgi:ABC-type branched-subunit amino acid transport system ATPase component/predicted MFS family arabinose efflux permease